MHSRCLLHSIMCFLLSTAICNAGFVDFPITNNVDWYSLTNNPIGQIYSGIVERAEFAGVAAPSIVETWTVFDGYSTNFTYWTNGATTGTYTNVVIDTTTVTTTNQFGPFTYTPSFGGTATGYPYLTMDTWADLDTKLESLFDDFIAYNAATNPTKWHSTAEVTDWIYSGGTYLYTNSGISNYPITTIPAESMENLFYNNDIGYVEDALTNEFGIVTNGTAYWTRQPEYTNAWLIGEAHYTGSWYTVEISQFQKRLYETNFPSLKYIVGGTNAFGGPVNVTVAGTFLNLDDQTTSSSSEIVALSTTNNTPTTKHWFNITSITPASSFNTGDVVSLVYTGKFALYGDKSVVLYAEDLNERYEAIKALKYTKGLPTREGPSGTTNQYDGNSVASASLAAAITSNQGDWATNGVSTSGLDMYANFQLETNLLPNGYNASSFRRRGLTNLYYSAIATNVPWKFSYYGVTVEDDYGEEIVDPFLPGHGPNRNRFLAFDFNSQVAAPDTIAGNKYSLYHADTNWFTGSNVNWNGFVAKNEPLFSDNPIDDMTAPTLSTSYRSDVVRYQWSLFLTSAGLRIGTGKFKGGSTGLKSMESYGVYYFEHDFEYD